MPASLLSASSRHAQAVTVLAQTDPTMGRLIHDVGPCTLAPRNGRTPFESLARAIAYQQLHANAAASIVRRFIAHFPNRRFPGPEEVLGADPNVLRAAGFSAAKIAALKDLAAKVLDGTVPSSRDIRGLDDETIISRLMAVRGIGRWTAEMLLIFQLGRLDILPVDDFGVRNGFRIAYKKRSMPKPRHVLGYGERWRPYRTIAAWYLWRAVDRAKDAKPVPGVTA